MSQEEALIEEPHSEEEDDKKVFTAKDPKKVEQGKRLAAISREAKEKKMRARIKKENFSYLPWISYGFSLISAAALIYLLYPAKKEEEILRPVTVESPKKKNNFVGFYKEIFF